MTRLPVAPIAFLAASVAALLWAAGVVPGAAALRFGGGFVGAAVLYAAALSLANTWRRSRRDADEVKRLEDSKRIVEMLQRVQERLAEVEQLRKKWLAIKANSPAANYVVALAGEDIQEGDPVVFDAAGRVRKAVPAPPEN